MSPGPSWYVSPASITASATGATQHATSILARLLPPMLRNTAQRPGPHSSPVPAVRLDKAKAMPGCPERGQRHVKTRHVCSTKSTVACFVLARPVVFSPPALSQMPLREDVRQQCSCSCPYHRRRTSRGLRSSQLDIPCIRSDTGPRGRLSHAAVADLLAADKGDGPLVSRLRGTASQEPMKNLRQNEVKG